MTTTALKRNKEAELIVVEHAVAEVLAAMLAGAEPNSAPEDGSPYVFIGQFVTDGVLPAADVLPQPMAEAMVEAYEALDHVVNGTVVLTGADPIKGELDGEPFTTDQFGNTHVVNARYDGEIGGESFEGRQALFGVNVDAGTFELYVD
jgi:hypothetical protein